MCADLMTKIKVVQSSHYLSFYLHIYRFTKITTVKVWGGTLFYSYLRCKFSHDSVRYSKCLCFFMKSSAQAWQTTRLKLRQVGKLISSHWSQIH